MSIPVICDRCRATGIAGEADFSHLGDLLDFTPVPRKTKRVDGWSPERQRAFIAALSATGSKRQAALAIGMQPYGVDRLLKDEGSESFKAAVERAKAIAAQHGSMRIAQGVADAAARNAQLTPPSRLRGLQSPPLDGDGQGWVDEPDDEHDEEQKWHLIQTIGVKFMRKVAAEREARLAGEIVAADFYLRQITFMEVMIDLLSCDWGWDPQAVLQDLRRGDTSLLQVSSTWLSDWMDRSRRLWWQQEGEPERPAWPDTRFLERRRHADGDYAVAVDMSACNGMRPPPGITQEEWDAMSKADQRAAIERQRAGDAEEQRAWEAKAHRDFENRRDSSSVG